MALLEGHMGNYFPQYHSLYIVINSYNMYHPMHPSRMAICATASNGPIFLKELA
jgi:hypothetical protein